MYALDVLLKVLLLIVDDYCHAHPSVDVDAGEDRCSRLFSGCFEARDVKVYHRCVAVSLLFRMVVRSAIVRYAKSAPAPERKVCEGCVQPFSKELADLVSASCLVWLLLLFFNVVFCCVVCAFNV